MSIQRYQIQQKEGIRWRTLWSGNYKPAGEGIFDKIQRLGRYRLIEVLEIKTSHVDGTRTRTKVADTRI